MYRKQHIVVSYKEKAVFKKTWMITSDYLIRGLAKRAVALSIQQRQSYRSSVYSEDAFYIDMSETALIAYAAYASNLGWKKALIYWSPDWEQYLICNGNHSARDGRGHYARDLGYNLPPVPQPKVKDEGSYYDSHDLDNWYDHQQLAYLG
jgi:hypothetical protein